VIPATIGVNFNKDIPNAFIGNKNFDIDAMIPVTVVPILAKPIVSNKLNLLFSSGCILSCVLFVVVNLFNSSLLKATSSLYLSLSFSGSN